MVRPMSPERRNESQLIEKATRELFTERGPIEKLRYLCLQRGVEGIIAFGRMFRRMDRNKNGSLSKEEFGTGIIETGLNISNPEMAELFKLFDKGQDGNIDYNDFLIALRPPLNDDRLNVIRMAFEKIDKNGHGTVTIEDLKHKYNVKYYPAYMNGTISEDEALKRYLSKFERNGSMDGQLTFEEFVDYYSCVSASIDDDAFFILLMRNSWNL